MDILPLHERFIRERRLRHDIEAYLRMPPTDEEMALAGINDLSDLDDDTDWEALYRDVLEEHKGRRPLG